MPTATASKPIRRNSKEFATMFDGKTKAVVVLGNDHGMVVPVEAVRSEVARKKSTTVTRDADGSLYVRVLGVSWTVS